MHLEGQLERNLKQKPCSDRDSKEKQGHCAMVTDLPQWFLQPRVVELQLAERWGEQAQLVFLAILFYLESGQHIFCAGLGVELGLWNPKIIVGVDHISFLIIPTAADVLAWNPTFRSPLRSQWLRSHAVHKIQCHRKHCLT